MRDRAALIEAFLDGCGWGEAARVPLAGDASQRRYERLSRGAERAILMDAPPDRGEDVRPFVKVAGLLSGWGLSAPAVLSHDAAAGLLLLEDLGDDLYAAILRADPAPESDIYAAAVDVLAVICTHAPPPSPRYGPEEMTRAAGLAYEWYLRGAGGEGDARDFASSIGATLHRELPEPRTLVLRDYHAENLIWLPGRRGVARVGLLDFQDAAAGYRSYDLASLVTDIRREVTPDLRAAMEARYAAALGEDIDRIRAEVALLSVQRNLRILGTFARLAIRDGKMRYLGFLPRLWQLLTRDLAHPVAAEIAERVLADLPPPDDTILKRLAECRTVPAR